jgi:hypothetical protein
MRVQRLRAVLVATVALCVLALPAAPAKAAAQMFDIDVVPDPPWVAGVPGVLVVTAEDASGSVVADYTGQVTVRHLHFPSEPDPPKKPLPTVLPRSIGELRAAGDTLPAPYTFTTADGGSHSFDVTLTKAGDTWLEIVGQQGGDEIVHAVRVSVVAGPPAVVGFAVEDPWRQHWDGPAYAGQSFDFQPIVRVADAFGNPPRSVKVALGLSAGDQSTFTCGDGLTRTTTLGVAAFYGCAIRVAGTGYRLTASVAGLDPVVGSSFDVAAVPPANRHRPTLRPPSVDVTYHQVHDLVLTATVTNDDDQGRSVRLFALAPGEVLWDFVTQEIVREGSLDITVPMPEINTLYQVCDLGSYTDDEPAVCGTVVPVKVKHRVTISPGPAGGDGISHASAGSRQTFTVDADPCCGGQDILGTITLQVFRQQDGRWGRQSQMVATTHGGPVSFTVRWSEGQWKIRATVASTGFNGAAQSAWVRYSVP